MIRSIRMGLVVCFLGFATTTARADLVINGGFETGDFTGWTAGNFNTVTSDPAFAHSGTYGVHYGAVGAPTFLFQNIVTTPGASYTFDFYQKTLAGIPNEFQAFWDGTKILDLVNSPIAADFTHYSFAEVASAASTEIKFGLRQDPAYSALDDVSVNVRSVPEPASLTMLALGGAGLIGYTVRRRRHRAAQA